MYLLNDFTLLYKLSEKRSNRIKPQIIKDIMEGNVPPQAPQQLYMTPQSENLTHLYKLLEQLIQQLATNNEKKENILVAVDTLSNRVNSSEISVNDHYSSSARLIQQFLDRIDPVPDSQSSKDKNRVEETLRQQNKQLKEILLNSQSITRESYDILKYHEECLHEVIGHLRADILKDQRKVVNEIRTRFNKDVKALEDIEFQSYIDNVNEIQKLMDISYVYRTLLRLVTQTS